MNKIKNWLIILLCIGIFFCLPSCQKNHNDSNVNKPIEITEQWEENLLKSDTAEVEYDYYFETVKDLINAIKHDPDLYNNKKVKVLGTLSIYKSSEDKVQLVDFIASSANLSTSENKAMTEIKVAANLLKADYKIYIDICSDTQYSVAEIGDYVKIYGTVTLNRNGIYINDCKYDMIATLDDRKENIANQMN